MKYLIYILLALLFSACDLEKKFHTAYLTEEEVVFENVQMWEQGRFDDEYYISNLSSDGTLISRCLLHNNTGTFCKFWSSFDNGFSWQEIAKFRLDSINEQIGCNERSSTYLWLENQNTLYSVGSYPDFSLDISHFQEHGSYDAFDIEISPSKVMYKNQDTILRRFFFPQGFTERSLDGGKTWIRSTYSKEKVYRRFFSTERVENTVVTELTNLVYFTTNFGKTWNKNKQLQQYFDDKSSNGVLITRNLKKLSSGELHLFMEYLPRQREPEIPFRHFISSSGIQWKELLEGRLNYPYLIDKLDKDTYIIKSSDKNYPIELITKYQRYKLPFPTHDIEYTKSGYWYYYDQEKQNICRRKIVLR